jgi:hypothetical protein
LRAFNGGPCRIRIHVDVVGNDSQYVAQVVC